MRLEKAFSATAVDPADGSTTIGRGSEGHNRKARKDCAIEAVIQGEKAGIRFGAHEPDQEIGEDTARDPHSVLYENLCERQ